jgi:hypothetical protein
VAAGSASAPASTTSLLWSRVLSWAAVAVASAVTFWSRSTPWSLSACDAEPVERMFALTAASIGAATLALAATARSIGAAASMARLRSALRSRIDTTSLSGSAMAPSASSSASDIPALARSSVISSLRSRTRHARSTTVDWCGGCARIARRRIGIRRDDADQPSAYAHPASEDASRALQDGPIPADAVARM